MQLRRRIKYALVVAPLIALSIACSPKYTFEQARKDPSLRQAYIDHLVEERGLPEYVNGIEYADTAEELEIINGNPRRVKYGTTVINNVGGVKDIGKGKVNADIIIGSDAFDDPSTKGNEDFSVTIEKEIGNAECFYEGPGFGIEKFSGNSEYSITAASIAMELCGYEKIIDGKDALKISGVSEDRLSVTMEDYYYFYTGFWSPDLSNISPENLDFLKIRFFKPFIMENVFENRTTGKWALQTKLGEEFYYLLLPDEIKELYGN